MSAVDIERGAWKFEQWLDRQKTEKEIADAEYKSSSRPLFCRFYQT